MNKNKHNIPIKDGKSKGEETIVKDEKERVNESQTFNEKTPEQETDTSSEWKDKFLRKAAEFENYKRRTDAEISNYIKYASEKLIGDLIPVYDDLQRSIDSIDKGETKDFEALKTGMALIFDKFKNVLNREGLTEINSLGKEFDVNVNSALMMVPRDDVKPNTVIDIVEKGYKLKDKVIKHEKVLVSSQPHIESE